MPTKHPIPEIAAEVARFTRAGLTVAQVAMLTDVAARTLQRHYRVELHNARLAAAAALGESVYARGLAGDNTCAIFWLKTRAGWTERTELTGADGAPLIPSPSLMLVPVLDSGKWREQVARRQAELIATQETRARASER